MRAPLATDLDEVMARLNAAREAGDDDGAIDAVLDFISVSAGMPGISQRLREIMASAHA